MRRALPFLLAVLLPWLVRAEEGVPPLPEVKHRVGVNRVVNGDFEKKHVERPGPLGWEEPDGLTSFWEKVGGKHGRVIRLDTDVKQSEHDRRLEEMKIPHGDRPPPGTKSPTTPPKYDTVGGNKGATLRSDRIPIEQGATYRLTVDVWSKGPAAKVWVKGYGIVPRRGSIPQRERKLYDRYKQIRGETEGWQTFTSVCHPTRRPGNLRGSRFPVRHVRIQLYAYWPSGEVLFDNVRFEKIEEKDEPEEKKEEEEAGR
jgi:hypothetical protein